MIKIFDGNTDDFSGQGYGYVYPTKAEVHGVAGSEFEILLELPIDKSRDDWEIDHQRIISAPAPVRSSPEINFGISGEITRHIFKTNAKVKMYNLNNRKKALKTYKKGTELIRIGIDGSWYKVSTINGGTAGWMKSTDLVYSREVNDKVINDVSSVVEEVLYKEQLFRIYNIVRDAENLKAEVRAEHITYDLKGVIVDSVYEPENIPADEVIAQILAKADQQDLPFNIYCGCTDLISGNYTGRNLIDCILNGEDGIATQCNARVVRDNFSIYILPPVDRYLGVDIRYGDNLIKANSETDSGSSITRIKPVGKNKKGDPIYITENNGFVDSPYASSFAVTRTKRIEYSEAQTGKNGLNTDTQVRQRLRELALEELEKAGVVTQKIDAKFVRKELTEEYKELANDVALHMYDIAKIKAARAGIVASVRMTEYIFDALPGRERYIDTKISDIVENEPMVYGVNIANNSVSGTKIIDNTLSGNKIKNLSVGIGKFDVAAIEQLNANSITAITGVFQEVAAGKLTTHELYASIADIFQLAVDNVEAGNIETDKLAAVVADIGTASLKTAKINYAQIVDAFAQRIFTDSMNAGKIRAESLEIDQAQIVDLIVGAFRLVSQDGKVYKVTIDAAGNLNTEYLYDQNEWLEDGNIPEGYSAVAGSLTVGDVTAGNLYVSGAAEVMKLTAKWLSADQAWIQDLTAGLIQSKLGERLNIQSNEAVVSLAGDVTDAAAQIEQTKEAVEISLSKKIDDETLRQYLRYEDGTVEMGSSDSRYKLQASNTGVVILQDGNVMTRMEQNTVAAPVFEAGRMLKIGNHTAKVSASGALVFN